jgi:hypothetical protein
LDTAVADSMPGGWQVWLGWQQKAWPDNAAEIQTLEADRGEYLGYVRAVGRVREWRPQSLP